MKAKTFIELATLSSNLYLIAKDTDAIDKIKKYTEMGKDKVNHFVSEKITDSEGNELEFVDKMIAKWGEAKEELENKIESVVANMYHKMSIAHTDQLKTLEDKIEALTKELSLTKSRIEELGGK